METEELEREMEAEMEMEMELETETGKGRQSMQVKLIINNTIIVTRMTMATQYKKSSIEHRKSKFLHDVIKVNGC